MKLTSRLISLITTGGIIATTVVDANMSIRGNTKSANKLMTFSRRLDDQQNYNNQNQYANNYQGGYNNGGQNQNQNYQNNGGGYGGGYGNQGDDDEESLSFLNNYSIKLLSCIQGEQVVNYEDGESEPSTVVFRLCPSNSCDMNAAMGCDSGYGDYAVGIHTFMEAYMESREDNNQNNQYSSNSMLGFLVYNSHGQAFDASEYMECAEYSMDENNNQEQNYYQYNNYNYNGQNNNNNGQNQNQNQNQQYNNNYQGEGQQGNYNYYQDVDIFIGPACSADGTTIGLSMFMEDSCSYAADMDFAQLADGWDSLPFANGGLISNLNCLACYGPDADYNYELREICTDTYAASMSRCESNMTSHSYYGQNTLDCDYVESLIEAVYGVSSTSLSGSFMESLGKGGKRQALIACLVLFCLAAMSGVVSYGYYYFHNKKKSAQVAATGKLLEKEDYEPPVAVEEEEYEPPVAVTDDQFQRLVESNHRRYKEIKRAIATALMKVEATPTTCTHVPDIIDSPNHRAPEITNTLT